MINLPTAPASDRNKQPILEQLQSRLQPGASVLEIGSGWGQHAVHFCRYMPGLRWQPSERAEEMDSLRQRLAFEGSTAIRPPIKLHVQRDHWPSEIFEAAYSANTAHIMSWEHVCSMFSGTSCCLGKGGLFFLYGPFNIDGKFTSASNEAFDMQLRSRSPEMGIRDIAALEREAASHQMLLVERITMPANNFLLVFEKSEE